jgi:hypothetical protein
MKAADHPNAPFASIVLKSLIHRRDHALVPRDVFTFKDAKSACWGKAGRASWCLYFLVLLGRLEKSPREDGFGSEYRIASSKQIVYDDWLTLVPADYSEVTIEYEEKINEKGWPQDYVIVSCDVSGDEHESWGWSPRSVWRCIFLLANGCSCGKKHQPRQGEVRE